MAPQPVLQTIAIHVLQNFSQNKDKLTMKLGQLIKHYAEKSQGN